MPNYDNNNLHGHLIITVDIQFPKNNFTEQDKEGNYFLLNTTKIVLYVFKYR